jgi:corrinoid protein of di/trimethylamine methyltransferase
MSESTLLFSDLSKAVLDGEDASAARLAGQALDAGHAPLEVVERGLTPGIEQAGSLWEAGEYFLPELVSAAQAMKAAIAVVQPALAQAGGTCGFGRVVIGTVAGDIHDIGKTLVATLLSANGFTVADEGADVAIERFVARARELDADLVCASALLTTTMRQQQVLVEAVRSAGLRARVLVGGAPVTQAWCQMIGADGYAENAVAAVHLARQMVARSEP